MPEPLEKQPGNNGKKPGGATGKGFMPGVSGNPAGRPKRRTLSEELRDMLTNGHEGKDLMAAMAKVAFAKALKGDHKFWHDIIERADGKVPDKIETDGNIRIRVEYVTAEHDEDNDDSTTDAASEPDAGEA